MDRKKVLLDEAQTLRQREFERKIAEIHRSRGKTPLAMVDTFGCQQNVADSQHIMGMLEAMGCGFTDRPEQADIVVLNTCAIRDHAEKRVYGNLGALTHTKKANPEQIICLCGCMAQRPEVAEKVRKSYRHVDLVFGPQAMWKFPELLWQVYTRRGRVFSVEDQPGTIAEGTPVVREGSIRAWVSIMYGCNNFCSYCIVPYVRGRERSREPEKILEEVRQLAQEGYKEITLLGQNVNSYGKDLETPWDFADLLAAIDEIPGDYLIRFMSSQPKDASYKLFDTMARCGHVARQLHLPVQSGCDRVLRAMNRPYDKAKYLDLITYARKGHARPRADERRDHRLPRRDGGRGDGDGRACARGGVRRALHLYLLSPAGDARGQDGRSRPPQRKAGLVRPALRHAERNFRAAARGLCGPDGARARRRDDGRQPLASLRAYERRTACPPRGGSVRDRDVSERHRHRQQHVGALR